ncbi:hypothetical protein DSECCO2_79750 [anaerobic digester metagenome]
MEYVGEGPRILITKNHNSMKTLSSFLSANQSLEVILNLNQLNVLKGGEENSTHDGEIIDRDKPIYIKE